MTSSLLLMSNMWQVSTTTKFCYIDHLLDLSSTKFWLHWYWFHCDLPATPSTKTHILTSFITSNICTVISQLINPPPPPPPPPPPTSFSVQVCVCVFAFSLFVSISLCLSVCPIHLTVSHFSVYHCVSLTLSLSLWTVCLSHSVSFSVSIPLSLCPSLSLCPFVDMIFIQTCLWYYL